MKVRILPLLGLLFAMIIVSRAYALSSDALSMNMNTAPDKNSTNAQSTKHVTSEANKNTDTIPAAAQCVTGDVLLAINEKMSALKAREIEMAQKESAFRAIETRLDKQMARINAAKASLDASVKSQTALAQADIEHLTVMYQTMKPKQAATIFNEMDIKFAAGFLRNMKGSHAGLILSNMNAKKAYQISLNLASTNAKYR